MKSILLELHYLPVTCYFALLKSAGELVVEKQEHFVKQTYRNRTFINTSQGKLPLIIPVNLPQTKIAISEVKIDYGQKWLNNHWRAILSAYNNAPFFAYYSDDLHNVLFRKIPRLYDLNLELLTLCLKWLEMEIPIRETSVYEKQPSGSTIDFRGCLNPKKEDSCNRFCKTVQYRQVFGSKFVHPVSLIDLIFCEGPGAGAIVQASSRR